MPYHIIALIGCLLVTTCCFGQVDGKRQPAPTSTQDTTSGNPEKPKRQKQVVKAAVQPCEDCPGPPGPCWLTCEQKTPIYQQVKVFVNVCSGERYIVWPLAKEGAAQVRKREWVKPGETVLVELIHVNPNAWNEVVFSDSSTISTTPEPSGFVFGNTPKPAAAEKTDDKSENADQPSKASFAPGSKPTPLAIIEAKIDDVTVSAETIRQQIEANDAQLNKLGNLLRELQRADKLMSSDPCFSADQLLRVQTPLREQVRSFVGEGVDLSDSEALTKILLGQITSYTTTQDSLAKAATALIKTDWKEDIITLSDLIAETTAGKPATTIKTGKAGSIKPKRGAARAVQPSAAEADTTKPVDLLQEISRVQMDLAELSRKVTEAGCRVDLLKKEQVPDLQKRIAALSQSFTKGQSLSARRYIMPGRTVSSMAESVTVRARGIRPDPKDAQKTVSSSFLNLTLPVVGGFELAFSTGLAVSTLVDYQYTIQTDSLTKPASGSVAAYKVAVSTIRENSNKIGAMLTTNLHGIWSVTPGLSVGFHFGVGLDIVNGQRARYMGGVSLKFGGISDNLLLNFGVITGQVKRLSASRVLNKTYEERIDSGAIPTYDKSDLGFYIGASYILFSKKIKKGL